MGEKELLSPFSANDLSARARRSNSTLSATAGRDSVVAGRGTAGQVGEMARGDGTRDPPTASKASDGRYLENCLSITGCSECDRWIWS